MKLMTILIAGLLVSSSAVAKHNSEHPLSEEDWKEVMERIALFDGAVFMPSLLPIIMSNRDALNLTDEQMTRFYNWRKKNYVNMVNIMNEVIDKKVQFSIEALSANVDDRHLLELQAEIHRLQHELLVVRLSCRDIVMETFTDEQWENFAFIAADNPRLASFFSQSGTISSVHQH